MGASENNLRDLTVRIPLGVLTVVTGAVRRIMERRRVDVSEMEFRVVAPVSLRSKEETGQLGKRLKRLHDQAVLALCGRVRPVPH